MVEEEVVEVVIEFLVACVVQSIVMFSVAVFSKQPTAKQSHMHTTSSPITAASPCSVP